jgi:hypothetical protein
MADPRLAVGFAGITGPYASYLADGVTITYSATAANGSAAVGQAVSLSGNGTVQLTADGDKVLGKLLKVESDGVCRVQTKGYMTLPSGAGQALAVAGKIVGAVDAGAARGYIRGDNVALLADVAVAKGDVIDVADATAIVVQL